MMHVTSSALPKSRHGPRARGLSGVSRRFPALRLPRLAGFASFTSRAWPAHQAHALSGISQPSPARPALFLGRIVVVPALFAPVMGLLSSLHGAPRIRRRRTWVVLSSSSLALIDIARPALALPDSGSLICVLRWISLPPRYLRETPPADCRLSAIRPR